MKLRNGKERPRKKGAALLFEKLRQSTGTFTIDGAFILMFVMMVLVLFISVMGVMNTSQKLHSVAAELTRYVELRGRVDSEVYVELDRLANIAGVTVESKSITGSFSSGSKLQLGADFTVTLTTTSRFGIGGILSVPVPLTTTVSGRSERYWK